MLENLRDKVLNLAILEAIEKIKKGTSYYKAVDNGIDTACKKLNIDKKVFLGEKENG